MWQEWRIIFRMPKQLLFGELTKTCPRHGPKKRWRDLAVTDVRTLGIERDWFEIAQDRLRWSALCEQFHSSAGVGEMCCCRTCSNSNPSVHMWTNFLAPWRPDETSAFLWRTTSGSLGSGALHLSLFLWKGLL